MTTPLSQMPKPEAGQYENNRKLFLVPAFLFHRILLTRDWSSSTGTGPKLGTTSITWSALWVR